MKNGPEKIDRGEFMIEEAGSKRPIDLAQDWELCFLPGQKVLMSMVFSMVFSRSKKAGSTCPNCGTHCAGPADEEQLCEFCGVASQTVNETSKNFKMPPPKVATTNLTWAVTKKPEIRALELSQLKRKREPCSDYDELGLFRRVCIRTFASLMQETSSTLKRCRSPNVGITKTTIPDGSGIVSITASSLDAPMKLPVPKRDAGKGYESSNF